MSAAPDATRTVQLEGAWRTVVRGVRLSPELRRGLGPTLLLALLATAGRAVVPVAIQQTLDRGITEAGVDLEAVAVAVGGAFVAVLITALASSAMNVRLARIVETALANLRIRTFRHIHDLSMLHQAAQQRGSLVARVTSDVDQISRFMQWGGLNLITSVGQLTIVVVVMMLYSWRLTLVVLVAFVPFLVGARWFQQRLTRAYALVQERVGRLLGVLAEAVVGAPVVRAYGIEERTSRRLSTVIEEHRVAALRAGRLSASFSSVGELAGSTVIAAAVLAGVWLGLDGHLTLGTVTAFLFLIDLFVEPVLLAAEVLNEAQTAVAGWRRVLDVLDLEADVADPGDAGVELPSGPVGIRFEDVRFRYPRPGEAGGEASGPEVLRDLDLHVEPRSRVAVVGQTGSGKTTFAKLLTRLMDPTSGRVLLNDVPVDRIRFDSLRERVVMVPQESPLFDGTIRDNLRMGRPEAGAEELEEALRDLGLADWLEQLPHGLDTRVGERGSSLSAGERQLVTLTRAALADPDLLVLDEATSAVDPVTEARLQRALAELADGRTTVTIAHRLTTAEGADEILVFDRGRLVERGTHEQLVDRPDGVYARLHKAWRTGVGPQASRPTT